MTALERAFQLARSGHMATIEDIKKRLKQEGYDQRAVADGGPCLTMQIRGLISGRPGLIRNLLKKSMTGGAGNRCAWISRRSDSFTCTSKRTWLANPG